jgi:hypothetical protein
MKKLFHIIAATALLGGLAGCGQKEPEVVQAVDLRYRCESEYNLAATGAKAFTIVVTSSAPWSVTSAHPDWCIISEEEGEASPADAVHVGQGTKTNVRVQYYNNTGLDDRTDQITIQSDYWIGKVITVNQKGIAYLNVPTEELEQPVTKAGGDITFHVNANQNWSAQVTEGHWLSILDGATGTGNGTVTVTAEENASELRYAKVTVYDRNKVAMATVNFTQDGVQLVPAANEIRASYDQLSASVDITANAKWQVVKGADEAGWFTIDTPTGEGNGTIKLTLTQNDGAAIRKSSILVRNVSTNPDDPVVEKEVVVKQAYKVMPQRYILNDDEIAKFDLEWANAPVYTKDVGTLFKAQSRLHNSNMPFGTYTFRWSNFTADPAGAEGLRCRHWFCFPESCELKFDIRPVDGKISFDFNVAGDGNKPSIDAYTNVDFTQPIEITYKFDPSGSEYCKVTYLVNGVVAGTFETSEKLLRSVKWGQSVNMYFGADKSGSAILEWYEYTAPLDWDE